MDGFWICVGLIVFGFLVDRGLVQIANALRLLAQAKNSDTGD